MQQQPILDSKGRPVSSDAGDRCPECGGDKLETFVLFGGQAQVICQRCGHQSPVKEE